MVKNLLITRMVYRNIKDKYRAYKITQKNCFTALFPGQPGWAGLRKPAVAILGFSWPLLGCWNSLSLYDQQQVCSSDMDESENPMSQTRFYTEHPSCHSRPNSSRLQKEKLIVVLTPMYRGSGLAHSMLDCILCGLVGWQKYGVTICVCLEFYYCATCPPKTAKRQRLLTANVRQFQLSTGIQNPQVNLPYTFSSCIFTFWQFFYVLLTCKFGNLQQHACRIGGPHQL